MAVMDQVFSSQHFATSIYDAWSQCIFSPGNITSFFLCLGPVPLCLCTFFVRHIHKHTPTNTHTISQGYITSCCLKSLFHLISSNRQTCGSGAGWRASYKKNAPWLNGRVNVVAPVQREYNSFCPPATMINSVLYTFIHQAVCHEVTLNIFML